MSCSFSVSSNNFLSCHCFYLLFVFAEHFCFFYQSLSLAAATKVFALKELKKHRHLWRCVSSCRHIRIFTAAGITTTDDGCCVCCIQQELLQLLSQLPCAEVRHLEASHRSVPYNCLGIFNSVCKIFSVSRSDTFPIRPESHRVYNLDIAVVGEVITDSLSTGEKKFHLSPLLSSCRSAYRR